MTHECIDKNSKFDKLIDENDDLFLSNVLCIILVKGYMAMQWFAKNILVRDPINIRAQTPLYIPSCPQFMH